MQNQGTGTVVLNFTDGEQTVTANYWNCTREEFTAKEGQVLDLRVDAKLYKAVPHIPSSLIC